MQFDKATIQKILLEVGRIATAVLLAVAIILTYLNSQPTPTTETLRAVEVRATSTLRPPRLTTTPAPTASPTAAPTLTPTGFPVSPTPTLTGSLPLCTDHNPDVWHGLIAADGSCHYDHEHKHDPMEACGSLFGEPGAWFGGSSISYFWQTAEENLHKHEGYGWIVRCDIPADSNPADPNPNYIHNFRSQGHIDPMPFLMPGGTYAGGYLGRQHSFSAEAEVCRKSDDQCGVIRWGGWLNFGDLELRSGNTVITQCVPLADVSSACPHGPGGSKIHFDIPGFPGSLPRAATFFWYGEQSTSAEESVEVLNPTVIAFAMGDAMVDVQLATLYTPDQVMFCPEMDCIFNGSTLSQHELTFNVRASLFDPDGDGFASGLWFVDQYGRANTECMSIGQGLGNGLFCIPLLMDHVPVGPVEHGDPENLGLGADGARDFDLSPAGEWWITWPLKMLGMEHIHP